jgi:hypothetical protein
MSKVATSPVEKFSGTVTLYDPLNMAQTLGWEKAIQTAESLRQRGIRVEKAKAEGKEALEEPVYLTDFNAIYLPAILACVEAWSLTGIPPSPTLETFPFSPRLASAKLIDWLIGEISKIYTGEEEDGAKNA